MVQSSLRLFLTTLTFMTLLLSRLVRPAASFSATAAATTTTRRRLSSRACIHTGVVHPSRTPTSTTSLLVHRRPYQLSLSSRRLVSFLAATSAAAAAAASSSSATVSVSCSPPDDSNNNNDSDSDHDNNDDSILTVQPFDDSCIETDHYNGISLHLDRLAGTDFDIDAAGNGNGSFETALTTAMELWKQEGRKGIWMHVPTSHADKIPIAVKAGFEYHMVKPAAAAVVETTSTSTDNDNNDSSNNTLLVLKAWLPDTPSRLPIGPHHQVGVGCVVFHPNDASKMLVVQEKTGPAAAFHLWKMPTGLVDPVEEIYAAAVRELREETGLVATFDGILAFRQAHRGRSASDLFFVCRLALTETNMDKLVASMTACPDEIAAMKWMPVQEYCDQERWQSSPVYMELNNAILYASHQQPFHRYTLPLGEMDRGTNTLYKSKSPW